MSNGPAVAAHPAAELADDFNPFLAMAQRFETAADHLDLDAGVREVLRTPDRELTVAIPIASST